MIFTRVTGILLLALFFVTGLSRAAEPQKEQKMKNILISPDLVDFKLIKVGKAGAQIMTITNKGKTTVTIKSMKKIKPPFSIETKLPRTIEPGKSLDLKLIFRRTKPEEYKGPVKLVVTPGGELIVAGK